MTSQLKTNTPYISSIQLLKPLHRANIFTKLDLRSASGRRMNGRWCLISLWVILNICDSFWTYQCPGGPPSTCEQYVEILLEHFCLCVKNPYMNTRCMFTECHNATCLGCIIITYPLRLHALVHPTHLPALLAAASFWMSGSLCF